MKQNRKRIGISFINSVQGGPRIVTINHLKLIPVLSPECDFIVFTDTCTELGFLDKFHNVKIVIIPLISKYALLFWEQILLPFYLKRERIDLVHGTKNSVPLFGGLKKICTIHDLAYYILPETFTLPQRIHLKISAIIASFSADKIVSVSNNTKKDIQNILKINENRIVSIYNGVDKHFFLNPSETILMLCKEKFSLPEKYILHVGTIQPRKNIDKLIDAFILFKREWKNKYHLVLAGRKGWMHNEIIKKICASGMEKFIHFTGVVSDQELKALYRLSYIFIYPSNYDGFGLVPLEAMASGTPVICSKISSLPEVVGNAALLINQKNEKEIKDALIKLVYDEELYEKIKIRGIKRAYEFTWEKSAKQILATYYNALV